MGRHSEHRRGPGRARQSAGEGRGVDPHDRGLIEPDRELDDDLDPQERSVREGVFTDRDPADDIRLAAQRPDDPES